MSKWTLADMPSQQGKVAVVTGTGGLGYEDALALAQAGADVIVAGRNAGKGDEAVAKVRQAVPGATIGFEQVDLASLASVRSFTERLAKSHSKIDILINNAGVMVPPQRQVTTDGFELQFGTNYLGHFALTSGLMPLLKAAGNARVISLSSVAARNGQIHFDDLQFAGNYVPMAAYGQSKVACLMFARELHRRSVENGWGVTSIGAHPGVSRTDLLHNAPGRMSLMGLTRTYLWFLFQPAAQGALPTLYAATAAEAQGGAYYGPNGMSEIRGYPAPARVPPAALDAKASKRLWEVSEELSGARFS
ncbi:NADP-dependent 3-hydroxy acid dehydrogenase YdfG [Devosia lucknowensis]|uniref:NADP-dependent 3-hydroxy acid dehydrogenase YdfG n=1 Tax=Devosia lucknowensis TaxID=1096929 RepID=A0A1Y6FCE0_9HYPH|nr:SDR family oxidoreductase [Devosia lucknowensis]SMQ70123.1 NADP-dependent 3-hydroxy acid dehydrogenase YdfG [Devosia lucknowensis]